MRGKSITKRLVDGLKAADGEYFVWDRDVKGFGLRVQPTGEKAYVVKYRAGRGRGAPTRRVTLAPTGTLTPDEARTLAKTTLGSVAHGVDPAALRTAERRASTLRELADVFLSEHVDAKRKPATGSLYRGILERIVLPELGTRQGEKVTTADLARLHVRMKDRPYVANRMLAVVGSLYTFAGRRKLVPAGLNPTRGIEKYPERGRQRFLTGDELARLGDAIREAETVGLSWDVDRTKPTAKHAPKEANRRTVIDPFAAAAIRLLILTGARLREILKLEWAACGPRTRHAVAPRQQDRGEIDHSERARPCGARRARTRWRPCDRRPECGHGRREAARRPQQAVALDRQAGRPRRVAHPRSAAHARELRRRGRPRASDHRQAARPHAR